MTGFWSAAFVTLSTHLRDQIDNLVTARGAVVIDVVARGEARAPVFEIFVDTLEGVTLDLCRDINRDVQELLDREFEGARYRLEVSSPGSDRSLKFPWQYRKHIGRTLELTVVTEGSRTTLTGRLQGFSDAGVTVETGPGNKVTEVGFSTIVAARVKTPW